MRVSKLVLATAPPAAATTPTVGASRYIIVKLRMLPTTSVAKTRSNSYKPQLGREDISPTTEAPTPITCSMAQSCCCLSIITNTILRRDPGWRRRSDSTGIDCLLHQVSRVIYLVSGEGSCSLHNGYADGLWLGGTPATTCSECICQVLCPLPVACVKRYKIKHCWCPDEHPPPR